MRILHVSTRQRRGGAERNLTATIAWEMAQGYDVHLAIGADSLASEFPSGAAVHVIPALVRAVSPLQDFRAYLALRHLIRVGRFAIVHTHQSKAGVLGRLAARGQGNQVVHTIHMASFGPAYNRFASILFMIAERLCARFTTRLVSVGTELVAIYRAAGIGREGQYVVIRSPIDIKGLVTIRDATRESRDRARSALGMPTSLPVALVIASLEPRKRVDLVIRALAPLLTEKRIQLAIGGDGPQREHLQTLAGRLAIDREVHFLGHITNIPQAMNACDVLVHAATVEGVPQVVIQALAAGVPVAATEMIGLREIPEAPVFIGAASGRDLADVVLDALASPGKLVPVHALDEWRQRSVEEARANLHHDLARLNS